MRIRGAVLVLLCGVSWPLAAQQASIQGPGEDDPPLQRSTDEQAYCAKLGAVVDRTRLHQAGSDRDVDLLIREGKAECEGGHVGAGVHMLRAALVRMGGE